MAQHQQYNVPSCEQRSDDPDSSNLTAELEDLECWLQSNGIVDLDPYRPDLKRTADEDFPGEPQRRSQMLLNREQMEKELASLFTNCISGHIDSAQASSSSSSEILVSQSQLQFSLEAKPKPGRPKFIEDEKINAIVEGIHEILESHLCH
ncbi:hypothetical protein Ciccas_001720 [Cichlidogyrus casuarinus]|uniref:Uncharacterized protein n=1 Tax=Cichlidogyrus casuarinus TaxID=1844966 RepID=A0ABD2QLI9_9PLAT